MRQRGTAGEFRIAPSKPHPLLEGQHHNFAPWRLCVIPSTPIPPEGGTTNPTSPKRKRVIQSANDRFPWGAYAKFDGSNRSCFAASSGDT